MTTTAGRRCSCHSDRSLYGSLVRCPSCRHWSYDTWAASCERRKCAYVGPLPPEPLALGL
jgi:hypothetical protein